MIAFDEERMRNNTQKESNDIRTAIISADAAIKAAKIVGGYTAIAAIIGAIALLLTNDSVIAHLFKPDGKYNSLKKEYITLKSDNEDLNDKYDTLLYDYDALKAEYDTLNDDWQDKYDELDKDWQVKYDDLLNSSGIDTSGKYSVTYTIKQQSAIIDRKTGYTVGLDYISYNGEVTLLVQKDSDSEQEVLKMKIGTQLRIGEDGNYTLILKSYSTTFGNSVVVIIKENEE